MQTLHRVKHVSKEILVISWDSIDTELVTMAYGTNAPFGFKPSVHLSGTPIVSSDQNEYQIASGYATNIFIGDPVTMLDTGTIGRVTAGAGGVANSMVGVFCGVKYTDGNGNLVMSPYWPGGTITRAIAGGGNVPATAFVWDAPDILYDVQVATTVNNGYTFADVGSCVNVDFTTAGTTANGISGATISAIGTNANQQFKIVRLTPNPKNQSGITNNNWLVVINQYFWANNSQGI